MRQPLSIPSRLPSWPPSRPLFQAVCLALVSVIILAGCAQPASEGIPTPNATIVAARQTTIAQSAVNVSATQTAAAPTPAPTPEPPTPVPPVPTEPPPPTPEPEPTTPPRSTNNTGTPSRQPSQSGSSRTGCGQRIIHVVQPGQNLFRIALRYNTTINAIARLNGITNTRLVRAGQRLHVVTCARGSGSQPAYGAYYVVKRGDTLFRIAVRYGTSVSRLMSANGLRTTMIVPGQHLAIP